MESMPSILTVLIIVGALVFMIIYAFSVPDQDKPESGGNINTTLNSREEITAVQKTVQWAEELYHEAVAGIQDLKNHISNHSSGLSELLVLEQQEEILQPYVDAAVENRETFFIPKQQGQLIIRIDNFDEIIAVLHKSLLIAIDAKRWADSRSVEWRMRQTPDQLLVEKAKLDLRALMQCVESLVVARLNVDRRFLDQAETAFFAFLVDISASDGEICNRDVELLNALSGARLSSTDYMRRYVANRDPGDRLNDLVGVMSVVEGGSRSAVGFIGERLYNLALKLIAVDGSKDEAELQRLAEYEAALDRELSVGGVLGGADEDRQSARRAVEEPDLAEEYTLDELLDELNRLVGLESVKQEVNNLCNLVRVNEMRRQANLPTSAISMHLVFTGNPGTGKTTVARLLARIYRVLGLLSRGQLVEVTRGGLVAGYVGQTAIKTQEVIDQALGGILFIDEAYSLSVSSSDMDFGREAIETLLKAMEDHRDNLIVIVAGYPNEMTRFIRSNPGLESRFSRYLHFPDYTAEEMYQIFRVMAENASYVIAPSAERGVREVIAWLLDNRAEHFGNARAVRNTFEQILQVHSNRMIAIPDPSVDDLQLITEEDIPVVAAAST